MSSDSLRDITKLVSEILDGVFPKCLQWGFILKLHKDKADCRGYAFISNLSIEEAVLALRSTLLRVEQPITEPKKEIIPSEHELN